MVDAKHQSLTRFARRGTHVPLSKKLDKEGYKLTKNQTYVDATINGLYDVLNNMVIDLHLTPYSEQKAYYEQIPNLQKGDIVIHDRNAAVPIFHTSY